MEIYVIGGFVCDYILKRGDVKDVDFVVVGSGIELVKEVFNLLFGKLKVFVFKNYGMVMLKINDFELEFVGVCKEFYEENSWNLVVENGILEDD